jgi:dTMP kinase
MQKQGNFFVLEGLDGSGKTTIIDRMKGEYPDILYTREPGGSEFGERIRTVLLDQRSKEVPPLPFLLGFMTARASHFHEKILPALRKGQTVLSDRFDASTFAFQLYGQQNLDLEDLFWYLREEIIRTEEGVSYRPHYIYLNLSPDVASERRLKRQTATQSATHFDLQSGQYHERVREGYETFFEEIEKRAVHRISPAEHEIQVVDADRDFSTVYRTVRALIIGA